MIDVSEVGAFPSFTGSAFQIRFGVYLPGIRASDGFDVVVRVIPQVDRFDINVQPEDSHLTWDASHPLDLWSATVPIQPAAGTHFGDEGLYLYRFQLWWTPAGGSRQLITRWFTDPFAVQTDVGLLSGVLLQKNPQLFNWTDGTYKTPELDDLIVYELQIEQFNDTFQGVIDRLVYLQSLGVNCIEIMPVTSTKLDFDWGYGPLHYFSPSAHFGGPDGLRQLVDACHQANMAVILDVVYQHVDPFFAYALVYQNINNTPGAPQINSPMIGANGPFGPQSDFSQTFTQQYFAAVNRHWLNDYHVDGFRYDEVTDLYVSPTDSGYALLAYETYNESLGIARFQQDPSSYSRIIQCAEALWRAPDVLRNTYTNCAWQDDLLDQAEGIAAGAAVTDAFPHLLDPSSTAPTRNQDGCERLRGSGRDAGCALPIPQLPRSQPPDLIRRHDQYRRWRARDRSLYWRMQPLAIALYTSQGVPIHPHCLIQRRRSAAVAVRVAAIDGCDRLAAAG